jgi:hypothetical protein
MGDAASTFGILLEGKLISKTPTTPARGVTNQASESNSIADKLPASPQSTVPLEV